MTTLFNGLLSCEKRLDSKGVVNPMCMSAAMTTSLSSLIGVVIGAAASIIASIIATKGEIRRSREEREEKRQQEKRTAQRNDCIEIQEALWGQIRAISLMWLEDQKDYQETKKWNPKHQLSDSTIELELESGKRLVMLIQRITDDELRGKLEKARSVMSEKVAFGSPQEEQDHVAKCIDVYDQATEILGTRIRALS